ncbi:MAG: hypothetical protein ABMA15_04210 [Vicinamibacterales bacterium]
MQTRSNAAVSCAVAIALAIGLTLATTRSVGHATAQTTAAAPRYQAPRAADGHADLNGIWQAMNTANWDLQDHAARQGPVTALGASFSVPAGAGVVEGNEIPYQPWAAEKKRQNAERWLASDPEIKCYLPGVPRATYMPHPFQIVQSRNTILLAYEFASASRIVRMTKTEDAPIESWMGWSRGRWEGDTLVVDVTGFNDQTWFDRAGNFHSEALHVVERYTRTGIDHLLYEARIEDPKVFTRPWTISMPLYRRKEKNAQLLEYKCVEFVEELMYDRLRKR